MSKQGFRTTALTLETANTMKHTKPYKNLFANMLDCAPLLKQKPSYNLTQHPTQQSDTTPHTTNTHYNDKSILGF